MEDGRIDVRQLGTARQASSFPLDRVIAGWTEGVQLMVEGEKRRFWIPEALAYKGQREPKGMLVFDVELLSITRRAGRRRGAAAPTRRRTASGLAYRCSSRVTAGRIRTHNSTVTVQLLGLDDRRQDVRQLGAARPAGDLVPSRWRVIKGLD